MAIRAQAIWLGGITLLVLAVVWFYDNLAFDAVMQLLNRHGVPESRLIASLPAFLMVALIVWGMHSLLLRETRRDLTLRDFAAGDALRHLVVDSKWSSGKSDPDNGQVGPLLVEHADLLLRDAARVGEIRVWGRLVAKSVRPQSAVSIPADYWESASLDLITCWLHPEQSPQTSTYQTNATLYEDVTFNRAEILRRWPKANCIKRLLDKTRAGRDSPAFNDRKRDGTKWRPADL